MKGLKGFIKRNTTLFYRDKGVFFTSLITPIILLVLYVTFLGNIYKQSFTSGFGEVELSDKLINGFVASQLLSSLLAVCCVTVPFCANMLMVSDKVSGVANDIKISPISPYAVSAGYFVSALISSLCIGFVTLFAGLIYIAFCGWYMSICDVLLIALDVVILVCFGVSLSSLINFFLSSQGQISAVGTIVSAGYGFLCGAYMPISNFSDGLKNFLAVLPGTHATVMLRNHSMNGVFRKLEDDGFGETAIKSLRDGVDCNLYLSNKEIPFWVHYVVIIASIVVIASAYVMLNVKKQQKNK